MSEKDGMVKQWEEWAANATPMSEVMAAPSIAPAPKAQQQDNTRDAASIDQPKDPYNPAPY